MAMGSFDDEIREHLELKRRHGATDSELQRLEDEAFGPPSRPGEPDFPEQEGGLAEQSGNGVMADALDEPAEHEAAEAQTTIYEPAPADELGTAASEPPIESLDTVEHELPEPELEPEAPPSEERGPAQAEEAQPPEREPEPPVEREEASEEEGAAEQEDMLADTPEFLRDAPEDDELWFEQGKPKDFDF
ncbi:MAG: hypothetical protein AABM66_00600 [Actinomycetota bacterium]